MRYVSNSAPNIQFGLLKSLAEHLKEEAFSISSGFDFTKYSNCGLRECTVVWPNRWTTNSNDEPVLRQALNEKPYTCGREFFGLTTPAYDHLFVPRMQKPDLFGGQVLDDDATKEQVADNLYAFCEKMK